METHGGNEQQSESKPSSTDSEQSCANAVVKPSDSVDEAPLEPPSSGKLRRTALRFFGGRKSICVLPSFFGGRNKNQNKWPSKMGLSKSKTHDGLSKASWEDSPGNVPAGDFEFHGQKDATVKTPNSCSSEFGHAVSDQKSLSLPRQKKGLRGLFSSIRRHKKNRNAEFEKNEMVPMSYVENKEVPVAQVKTPQNNTECLGSVSEPYVPDSTNTEGGVTTAPECTEVAVIASEKDMTKESLKSGSEVETEGGDRLAKTTNSTRSDRNPVAKLACVPNMDTEAAVAVNGQPSAGSSDQISMIFGDVASLKSFDSLTGCGDITADQDDDSIADSTVSGERSRNAGKRSSCYVTYQGGGEDMATPDEVDGDYLQDLWESEPNEDFAHKQNPSFAEHSDSLRLTPEEPSSSHRTDISSIGALGVTENTATSGELLTPQSDHQESVPNSDEGYYDSTTPGPDEDGHDKSYRMKTDRLPRDSYSGDALYELFGPDDSLISPAFENQFKLSSPDTQRFLDVPVDVKERPAFGHQDKLLLELEKSGLTKQSMCQDSKEMSLFSKGLQNQGLSENMSLLNSKTHASFNDDLVTAEAFSQKGNMPNASHAFSQSLEHHAEKNKLMVSQSKNNKDNSKEPTHDLEDDLTVCFSQALVDFTKRSTEGMGGSESSSPFAQNMQALPAIVTFDVVDMDNEGEYDQQMDVTMEEEDITSPYEVFEESYLQKDAFAECDDRMFDFYEQSLLCNTWAIASLPRHLSLTRVNQSMPSPLALNRRSRSLDTDSLELDITDIYVGGGAAPLSYHRLERGSNRVSSLHRKKNGHTSAASDMKDGVGFVCLSWQPDAERTAVLPLSEGRRADKAPGLRPPQIRHAPLSGPAGSQPPASKAQQLTAMVERMPGHFNAQNTGLMNRPGHLPLQSEASVPQVPCSFPGVKREDSFMRSELASDGGGEGLFYSTAVNSQSYSQCCKMRPVGITPGMPHSGAPPNPGIPEGDMGFMVRVRKPADTAYPPLKHAAGANP